MSEINVFKNDQEKTFVVNPGTSIAIELEEQATIGYQWMISNVDEQILALQKTDCDTFGLVIGDAITRTFTFRAQAKGITPVYLTLERGWEEQDTAIDEFRVVVQVE